MSIYGADHYFFGSRGMKIFSRQTFFFSVSLSVKTFFRCHLPADNFFHACKKFSWDFFAFANKFFRIQVFSLCDAFFVASCQFYINSEHPRTPSKASESADTSYHGKWPPNRENCTIAICGFSHFV